MHLRVYRDFLYFENKLFLDEGVNFCHSRGLPIGGGKYGKRKNWIKEVDRNQQRSSPRGDQISTTFRLCNGRGVSRTKSQFQTG